MVNTAISEDELLDKCNHMYQIMAQRFYLENVVVTRSWKDWFKRKYWIAKTQHNGDEKATKKVIREKRGWVGPFKSFEDLVAFRSVMET